MAQAYTTKFRSYSDISREVERARRLSNLGDSIDFSLNNFIVGPLKASCGGRLSVSIVPDTAMAEPAKVDLRAKSFAIDLIVKEKIWNESAAKIAEARFILAHEVGHICLHKDDEFGFSNFSESERRFLERECFVEDQANAFAEIFLLSDGAVRKFDSAKDLFEYCDYYCGVPQDTVERRFGLVARLSSHHFGPRYDLNRVCSKCGGNRVAALFSYSRCDDCGQIRF